MQQSLTQIAEAWAADGHEPVLLSFAASSAQARQIENGVPADLFISADEDWMDHLARADLLRPGLRRDIAGNRLVLIAPLTEAGDDMFALDRPTLRARLAAGRLAMADPASVPAGKYAREALQSLGLWEIAARKLAPTADVRGALSLAERGEVPLAIVYATDAALSAQVRVLTVFPEAAHAPIRYPAAVLAGSRNAQAEAFWHYLSSARAQTILARNGFGPAPS